MFDIITIFTLTIVMAIAPDRLTQSLFVELTGELLTTIHRPYNSLQGI